MGPYLDKPITEKHTMTGNGKQCVYVCSQMQGWRNKMEDTCIVQADFVNDCSVFGIFDGHGGQEVAKFVEKHFLEELSNNSYFQQGNIEEALKDVFLKMDELMRTPDGQKEVLSYKVEVDHEFSFAGSCANVSVIFQNTLYVANAGDSRTVLCRNKKPYSMSQDHKPELPAEKQRIERAGGYVSDGRVCGKLNLSRALGDFEYKSDRRIEVDEQQIIALPEVRKVELMPTDKFLFMGCDGSWEKWSEQQLISFIDDKIEGSNVTESELSAIVESMLDQIIAPDTKSEWGCDSMTAIIIVLKPTEMQCPHKPEPQVEENKSIQQEQIYQEPPSQDQLYSQINVNQQITTLPRENCTLIDIPRENCTQIDKKTLHLDISTHQGEQPKLDDDNLLDIEEKEVPLIDKNDKKRNLSEWASLMIFLIFTPLVFLISLFINYARSQFDFLPVLFPLFYIRTYQLSGIWLRYFLIVFLVKIFMDLVWLCQENEWASSNSNGNAGELYDDFVVLAQKLLIFFEVLYCFVLWRISVKLDHHLNMLRKFKFL